VVSVIDNGPGVPPELKSRIFDPFFTTKPVGEGTGLGLDIARRLIARHDGSIDVDSRPGRTELRVDLPLESAAYEARHPDRR
jgi:signal transduction histidine kinase